MSVAGGGSSARKALTVTDFSRAMLEIARENLKDVASSGLLDLRVMEANGAHRCIIK
jgi:ubiquinone/menaquinone biosynthesis C-methylase UbiE